MGAVLGLSALVPISTLVAQEAPDAPVSATEGLRRPPRDAFRVEPAAGVPYRSIFRDTSAPYTNALRPIEADPSLHAGSVTANTRLALPSFRGRFPLLERGFEPKDADLKVGPVFFKLRALTAGLLFSDNVNHKEANPDSGVIGIVRLGGTVIVQLTEGIHLAVAGNIVYLPFKNKIGVAGFGLFAPYTLALDGRPVLHSQVTWETQIGGWNVIFADDFTIGAGRISVGELGVFDFFDGGQFDEQDREGRYSFRARTNRRNGSSRPIDTETEILYYSNKIGVTAERLLPGPVRLLVRAYHENLWYNQGNRGLPRLRDVISLRAVSERENLRFQPFLSYRAVHTDRIDGFRHEVRLGISGPITDQLHLHADVGWFHRDGTGGDRFLWGFELHHVAGPYTVETLSSERSFSDLRNELRDETTYRLEQVLGPKVRGEAFVSYSQVDDLENDRFDRSEWKTGVRFTLEPGPRTTLRLSGIYTDREFNGNLGHRQTWAGRLELTYHFTDTVVARLLYQYQNRNSNRHGDSFDENLLLLTVTKYFD